MKTKLLIICILALALQSCSNRICPAYQTKQKPRGGYGTGFN